VTATSASGRRSLPIVLDARNDAGRAAGAHAVGAHATDLAGADATTGELTFVGTATVLLRIGGITILTDPNFLHAGDHAYLGLGVRSRRLTEPALQPADLPPLDLVILSHHHGDHFDEVAARELDPAVPIITEPSSARKLREQGFHRPVPLRTWESQTVVRGDTRLRVTAMPAKHAPVLLGALLPSVMGAMVELDIGGRHRFRMYITGDTLMHDRLGEIPARFANIDLCLLHLGGTRIARVLLSMDAARASGCSSSCSPTRPCPSTTTTTRSSARRSPTSTPQWPVPRSPPRSTTSPGATPTASPSTPPAEGRRGGAPRPMPAYRTGGGGRGGGSQLRWVVDRRASGEGQSEVERSRTVRR
jgi:L-ascorbate metabolism protein UlaG (beta-lactamase superfamily)